LLRTLTLDPSDLVPSTVREPGDRDFIICGAPRTGTSLAAAILHTPPSSIVVMEPWDGLRLPPAELFASLRQELAATGGLTRGRLDLVRASEGEVGWQRDGARWSDAPFDDDSLIGVKWPCYWRYLPLLKTTKFVVCLRDPAEVVASSEAVGGRLRLGLDYDVVFNAEMNRYLLESCTTPARRRLEMFDYINERIIPHLTRPNVFALRYERWFTDPLAQLRELGRFLGLTLPETAIRIRPGVANKYHGRSDVRAASRTAAVLGYPSETRSWT
jgi:hypothetical protein